MGWSFPLILYSLKLIRNHIGGKSAILKVPTFYFVENNFVSKKSSADWCAIEKYCIKSPEYSFLPWCVLTGIPPPLSSSV